ncbi:hypothetical protein CRUP_006939 [Coryphaenoides rupestris]|nr:hypothetical protein CRUP_006939 [Coryphaenoides rupestris]
MQLILILMFDVCDKYIVADCGGGTVDLTVHQIEQPQGTLKELYKASGGPYGAVGVDLAFEAMLCQIFSEGFIRSFKAHRPAAWVDLTIAFEARKRTAAPGRPNALNVSLPFSFVDYYKRHRGHSVEAALRRSNMNMVKWSSQGMLRLTQEAMNELFQPTISSIVRHIEELIAKPEVRGVRFLFLVGGFAESPMLQRATGVQNCTGADHAVSSSPRTGRLRIDVHLYISDATARGTHAARPPERDLNLAECRSSSPLV